ncbi:unnamed protein product [Vitrella brassicaformis CCMP3155]|uniref:DUF192 domain-containing protein n=1 Tax=Vitrella brassicaformis (strain CCMP3155) TaxID=1169540 RepID=A0A0G4FP42_VITBC|nr:unnamed protein product [Vitrella brassicaformis CCMP3155]|eukprot:CEM15973.1 unnamed protein product [Vitrella brassicaformis CCMP3155]
MTIHQMRFGGLFSLLWVFLCHTRALSSARVHRQPATFASRFPLVLSGAAIHVQIAVSDGEHQEGLMGRQSLGENTGMLFVYSRPRRGVFWMKDTPLDLDAGFFDTAGVLTDIHHLKANDETWVYSDRSDAKMGLEMPVGWFKQHGITPGAVLEPESLRSALQARGG